MSQQSPRHATKDRPKSAPPQQDDLPPYKVLLHNDDQNTMEHVTASLYQVTPLDWDESREKMQEAHQKGVSLLLTTHKERAELLQEQLTSKGLTVTIEADES